MNYKHSKDEDFLFAAKTNRLSLLECIAWIRGVQKKMELDQTYRGLINFVTDPQYELDLAHAYVEKMDKAIEVIENPDRSTPKERHDGRFNIAQVRSWAMIWEDGAWFRDNPHSPSIPPSVCDAYAASFPSMISSIMVPANFEPSYDPFADDQ